MSSSTLQVAVLTHPGRGAVAVVRVEGSGAVPAVAAHFHAANQQPFAQQPVGRLVIGRWGGPRGERLVVLRVDEKHVEVHCHGGAAAVAQIVQAMKQSGAEELNWSDWLANGHSDPIRSAAAAALAVAPTRRGALLLLAQYQGALRREIENVLADISAEDFGRALTRVNTLRERATVGQHLIEPFRVVLAGLPNVGKSSLINAIVGYERAIVFDQAGTTRDVVTAQTALDGWPVQLADTAGLRPARHGVEQEGIERARAEIAAADLILWVADASECTAVADLALPTGTAALPPAKTLRVANKIDRVAADQRSKLMAPDVVQTSALYGDGMAELVGRAAGLLVPCPPADDDAIPFTHPQIAALDAASRHLAQRSAPLAAAQLAPFMEGTQPALAT